MMNTTSAALALATISALGAADAAAGIKVTEVRVQLRAHREASLYLGTPAQSAIDAVGLRAAARAYLDGYVYGA